MGDITAERTTLASKMGRVRWVSLVLAIGNTLSILLGGYLVLFILSSCSNGVKLPFMAASIFAGIRIFAMVGAGVAQQATAETIIAHTGDSSVAVDAVIRHERRTRYRCWLSWARFGMAVTVLQFAGALYLLLIIVNGFTKDRGQKECFLEQGTSGRGWEQYSIVSFLFLVCVLVVVQCFTGSDVLRWRSFYASHDIAWKAHYREVFDHGIREALCCLGRMKYMSVLEEDEVYSVARLLGDLMAYRASGTGHLELLAGLALMQSHCQSPNSYTQFIKAPEVRMREAAAFHQFAEAAYTGPLLDFGRNPILFPCAWLYRQGVFTPWTHNRRPVLEGDNWWRGHAGAFLKYVNLSPHALRRGRVSQTKREAAYFVVVLHDKKSIVIAVRGTETPEDLITDGLCRECVLSLEDLDGLLNSDHFPQNMRQRVLSTFPHYGHSGIVESARELYKQIDGQSEGKDSSLSETSGFLSSLLGVGCECYGYKVRIVGHSLGGAVATLLGLRLYRRYPNLHVYAYGTLPCVDLIIAEVCSDFVTTVVYNDEFSARLSVNSIIRLRAAAMTALSDVSLAESRMINKLARRILQVNKYQDNAENNIVSASLQSSTLAVKDSKHMYRRCFKHTIQGKSKLDEEQWREEAPLLNNSDSEILRDGFSKHRKFEVVRGCLNATNSRNEPCSANSGDLICLREQTSQSIEDPQVVAGDLPEMFLPGIIIHIVPEKRNNVPMWKCWKFYDRDHYKAFVTERKSFKDIVVTPYMFIDHLPWRCHYALQRILKMQEHQDLNDDLLDGDHMV